MIKEIKSQVSILDLLSHLQIKLNAGGFIRSIYKEEKTPSLKIYPATNSFYCFATDHGGDIIKFYEDYKGLDTKQAVKELAEIFEIVPRDSFTHCETYSKVRAVNNLILPKLLTNKNGEVFQEEQEVFDERSGIIEFQAGETRELAENLAFRDILSLRYETRDFVLRYLYEYEAKHLDYSIIHYLKNGRQLSENAILDYRLFGISNPQHTADFLKSSFTEYELKVSGLFTQKDYFLFTKHRVVIPYLEKGKYVFMKGRSIDNAKMKYIGLQGVSAKRFYNLDILQNTDEVILCEGEFDALKVMDKLGDPAIAIGGVGNFPNEFSILKGKLVYVLMDNDPSGAKAKKRISVALSGVAKKVIPLSITKKVKDVSELIK